MGYALRTDCYRLVDWKVRRHPKNEPLFIELYDHKADPDETVNVAAANAEVVKKLMIQLDDGGRGSLAKKK